MNRKIRNGALSALNKHSPLLGRQIGLISADKLAASTGDLANSSMHYDEAHGTPLSQPFGAKQPRIRQQSSTNKQTQHASPLLPQTIPYSPMEP
jgi:hypothetical protein